MDEGKTISRRRLLGATLALGAVAISSAVRPVLAQWRAPTPIQPAGPFYLPAKPLSWDNDLALAPGSCARSLSRKRPW